MSLVEFLQMGGYGVYVWSAYLLALIVLVITLIIPFRRERNLCKQIARRTRRRTQ